MSSNSWSFNTLVTRVRKFRSALITGLAIILMIGIILMDGCKTGGGGGSSNAGGSGGSGGSGASGGTGRGSAASGSFEGVVNTKMDSGGKTIQLVYYVRPDRVRTETTMSENPQVQAVQIMDLTAGKMTTLLPAQKAYMTMDFSEMRETAGMGKDRELPKLTATGRTETVAGQSCEHYLMGDEQKMDMCVAKGLGFFGMGGSGQRGGGLSDMMFPSRMKEKAAANPEWSKFLEGGAFPLKMTVTEGGKTTLNAEVTSIDRKKLDDSLFTVPADYKEMKVPAGMPPVPGRTGQ